MPTIEQIKAARALLGWSQADLASAAGLSQTGIARIENGESKPNSETSSKMIQAFTKVGIEFLDTEGVRRRKVNVMSYQGQDGFRKFIDEVYQAAKETSDDICLFNGVPKLIKKWCGEEWYIMHATRMKELKQRPNFRIIVQENEKDFIAGGFAEYKWFPSKLFKDRTIYVFADKIAFLNFSDDDVLVLMISQKDIADSFRIMFDISWNNVAFIK